MTLRRGRRGRAEVFSAPEQYVTLYTGQAHSVQSVRSMAAGNMRLAHKKITC